jgi:hypothetical protein
MSCTRAMSNHLNGDYSLMLVIQISSLTLHAQRPP